jgi:hypothetical protein
MKRAEHLQWAKNRALTEVKRGYLQEAFASFISDLGKHTETQGHIAIMLGMQLNMSGNLSTPRQMKDWINGTN